MTRPAIDERARAAFDAYRRNALFSGKSRTLRDWFVAGYLAALPEAIDPVAVNHASEDGKGLWRSCSGCHELNDGYPTGRYSKALSCHVGLGCRECGGIGAVWDMPDYAEMANYLSTPPPSIPPKTEEHLSSTTAVLTPVHLEGWATSIADMVIMWVDDDTSAGTDWRSGLRRTIERRLTRLSADAQHSQAPDVGGMTLDRAREIVAAICNRCFHAMGLADVVGDLEGVPLADMLEAKRLVKAENEKKLASGPRTIRAVPCDGLIAAAYALVNYEPSHGAVISEPDRVGLIKTLAIVRVTAAPSRERDHG